MRAACGLLCALSVGVCWSAARRGHGAVGKQGDAHSLQQRSEAGPARSVSGWEPLPAVELEKR